MMNSKFEQLKELPFYTYFSQIAAVPRGSGNEREISEYIIEFAKKNQLYWEQDDGLNVLVRKPGSADKKGCKPLILQCHMDMVCEKAAGSEHDFMKDPIRVMEQDGYLTAEGTSLGADNGVGMAYILSILAGQELSHPPLEAFFTTREEVGLEGMAGLQKEWITADRMINLDGEEEGVFYTSCAGGVRYYLEAAADLAPAEPDLIPYQITLGGLCGGHSGIDIDKGRGNAILLMARFLERLINECEVRISDICGGTKTNAIPVAAQATVWIEPCFESQMEIFTGRFLRTLQGEYAGNEPEIMLKAERLSGQAGTMVLADDLQDKILDMVMLMPNGLLSFSPYLDGVVESSANLGIMEIKDRKFCAAGLIRGNVNSKMEDTLNKVKRLAGRLDLKFSQGSAYPAWEYRENSGLRQVAGQVYQDIFGKKPSTASIHGGLECALMFEKKPEIDMISLGPDLHDVHTVNEKADIASIIRIWDYLIKLLERID